MTKTTFAISMIVIQAFVRLAKIMKHSIIVKILGFQMPVSMIANSDALMYLRSALNRSTSNVVDMIMK